MTKRASSWLSTVATCMPLFILLYKSRGCITPSTKGSTSFMALEPQGLHLTVAFLPAELQGTTSYHMARDRATTDLPHLTLTTPKGHNPKYHTWIKFLTLLKSPGGYSVCTQNPCGMNPHHNIDHHLLTGYALASLPTVLQIWPMYQPSFKSCSSCKRTEIISVSQIHQVNLMHLQFLLSSYIKG